MSTYIEPKENVQEEPELPTANADLPFYTPQQLIGLTEPQIAELANSNLEAILESGNVLQAAEQMKALQTLLETMRADKRLVDYTREETAKYGKGGFQAQSGAIIKLAEVGVKYDYSGCNDFILIELEGEAREASARLKQRQELLKCLPPEGLEQTDANSGEMYRIYPPVKTSTSSFTVTLKKK